MLTINYDDLQWQDGGPPRTCPATSPSPGTWATQSFTDKKCNYVLIDCNRGSCSSKDNDSTTTVAAESIVVAQRQLQQKNLEIAQGKLQQKR